MIVRDEHGIIVQHPSMDGGDSVSRMGIYALHYVTNLRQFAIAGLLRRHPYQEKWNRPDMMSRDQLICAVVSCPLSLTGVAANYAHKGRVNKDFLDFGVRLYLYNRSLGKIPLWIKILGYPNLFLSLLWNCFIRPNEEMNQFACICIAMGPWWCRRLIDWHPSICQNFDDYWSGWRDQQEIGDILENELFKTAYRRKNA